MTQNINETLIDQGLKNALCADLLYEKLQYKMTENDHANILALLLYKIDDDSFYNHSLLYNVFINYNYKNNKDDTMLHIAAKHGHVDIVDYLLLQKIDFNYSKSTPLHYAVKNHHLDVIKLLCQHFDAKNMNAKDEKGYTALHYVSPGKHGNVELFEYLVNHGADINIKHHGKTLLYQAVHDNLYSTVEYLLSKGANPYTSCKVEHPSRVYVKHYELCINVAINKYYLNITDQVNNYRIITLLSRYMKL